MPLTFSPDHIKNTSAWVVNGSCKARIVTATPSLDQTCGYIARVSSKDQSNPSVERLLRYCVRHGHWSVFEQGSLTVEVVTPLAIAVQLLRHRSFTFQQFSGRYQDQSEMAGVVDELDLVRGIAYKPLVPRIQDPANRQNSIPTSDPELVQILDEGFTEVYDTCLRWYKAFVDRGVAKEQARFVLPEGVYTRLFVTGNPRSFIHYAGVRNTPGISQHEHVELAQAVWDNFSLVCPIIAKAVGK